MRTIVPLFRCAIAFLGYEDNGNVKHGPLACLVYHCFRSDDLDNVTINNHSTGGRRPRVLKPSIDLLTLGTLRCRDNYIFVGGNNLLCIVYLFFSVMTVIILFFPDFLSALSTLKLSWRPPAPESYIFSPTCHSCTFP